MENKNKWLQRLLKLVFWLGATGILVSSCYIVYTNNLDNLPKVYSYSFQKDYVNFKGKEGKCITSTYLQLKLISCGDLRDSKSFMYTYNKEHINSQGFTPYSSVLNSKNSEFDFQIASWIIESYKSSDGRIGIYYKYHYVYTLSDYLRTVFYPLAITFGWMILAILFYRTVRYVMYGERIIKRLKKKI